jgi:hypothetical protein
MDNKFDIGQRVKIITIKGSDPGMDRQINVMAGKSGIIAKYYCIGKDEMPDLIKMVVYTDVYSYDIKLDESGDIVRGIPEAALELHKQARK